MSGFNPYGKTGSGTSTQPTFTPPESPFADDNARDVWAAANLTLLYNCDTNFSFTLIETSQVSERWSGANKPASYSSAAWISVCSGSSLNQDALIYVAKAGSDSRSGLIINDPQLTIDAAINYAILLVPL